MSLLSFRSKAQQDKTFDNWVRDLARGVNQKVSKARRLSSYDITYAEFAELQDGSWAYISPDLQDNVD